MTNVNEQNKLPQSDGPECFDDGTGIEPGITESEDRITEPFDPTLIRVETKPLSFLSFPLTHRFLSRSLPLFSGNTMDLWP